MINITKVVSNNFLIDILAKFQNVFGANLTGYEKMVDKGIKQIQEEMKKRNINLDWYRYEITQLTNGAVAIMLYGDGVEKISEPEIEVVEEPAKVSEEKIEEAKEEIKEVIGEVIEESSGSIGDAE